MPRGRKLGTKNKYTIDRNGLDKDRGKAGIGRAMAKPRTCAWCGERDAYVEYGDEERDQWISVCDRCNTPVKDPEEVRKPVTSSAVAAKSDRMRALRAQAKAAGLCPTCRCRVARPGLVTCQPCNDKRGWEGYERVAR